MGVDRVRAIKNGGGGRCHRRPERGGGMERGYSLHTGNEVIIFSCSFVDHRLASMTAMSAWRL